MATAATSLLGLALPVTGELSGTWGDTVNVSITALLDTAVAGTTTLSSDADVTLTTTTLAANQARQAIILWTAGGTVTRTITVPAQSKSYIVINKTSSSQSIKIVGVGPTTGVTIVAGTAAFVVWNGVDFVTVSVTSTTGILPVANGGTGLSSGTSGGVLAYTATGTLASSAALAASALVIGGGAGAAPSTTTTGTGVVTALGVNVGTAGAFVVNGGALGTPSSGTVTNLTGTASININGTVGATTPTTGAFTTLSSTTGANFATSSGNVGIGTSSPAAKLHIGGSTASTQQAIFSTGVTDNDFKVVARNGVSGSNAVQGYIGLDYNNGTWPLLAGIQFIRNSVSGELSFTAGTTTAAAEVMRLTSTGLAVTGTLSATGLATLASSQITGATFPASGSGLELIFQSAISKLQSFNRTGSVYLPLTIDGTTVGVLSSGSTIGAFSSTGLRVTGTPGDVTISTGNLIVGTAGKGIDFSATSSGSGTMTSELLADYEEGTWTPTAGSGLTVTGTFVSSGTYTKVGRLVTVNFTISATLLVCSNATQIIAGLPFSHASDLIGSNGVLVNAAPNTMFGLNVYYQQVTLVDSNLSTGNAYGSITYPT